MENLNIYGLLVFSLVITLTYSTIRNQFSKKHVQNQSDYHIFNILSSVLSAVVLALISGGLVMPSAFTVMTGIVFGIITAAAAIFNMQALKIGPFSYTSVIATSSMIIPALSGQLFWNETVSIWQYTGIALMVVSVILAVDRKNDNKKASLKWLLLCFLTLFFGGFIGILQKIHQSSDYWAELSEFLIIAFLVSAIFSAAMLVWYHRVQHIKKSISLSPKGFTLPMAMISGVCIALANQINLYLSGMMDSIIFFPAVNGGGLLLAALAAVIIFRERLTKKQWLGVIIGIISVLLLCNIF